MKSIRAKRFWRIFDFDANCFLGPGTQDVTLFGIGDRQGNVLQPDIYLAINGCCGRWHFRLP
jgi:hypothetical protein